MEHQEWLTINYTLPKEPSRVRVSVWRKLKKSGAVILGQSVWFLPVNEDHEVFLQKVSDAFVPQSSIIGMVLTHPNVYTVVRSNSISALQQNPYTWQVEQRKFVREKKLHSSSVYIERMLKKWLSEMDDDHRRGFVNSLFDVLESTEAKTFGKDFWMVILRNPKEIITTIKGIDSNTRQMLTATILAIANVATQYLEPQGEENEKISRMEDKKNG